MTRLDKRTRGRKERREGRREEGEGGECARVNSTVPKGRTEEEGGGRERGVSGMPNGPTNEEREVGGGGEGEKQKAAMSEMPAVLFKTTTCKDCSLVNNPKTIIKKPA